MTNLEKRPATKTAWVIVIIMSALFVLALLGVVWGFVRQSRIFMAARGEKTAVQTVSRDAATLILAPGARIVSATTADGRLVLHVATPTGGEVEIIDLASAKRIGQVKTQP